MTKFTDISTPLNSTLSVPLETTIFCTKITTH